MRNMVILCACAMLTVASGFSQTDMVTIDSASIPIMNKVNNDGPFREKVYRMHPKYQLPAAGAAIVLSSLGFKALDENARLSPTDALKLNPNDINAFDRPAALRNPVNFARDASRGDFFLNFSVASPVLLALDKHVRKDWVDILTLYMAAQAFDNVFYFASIAAVRRPRPMAYNPGLDSIARSGIGMTKSFFSGHVSFSSTATFFAVKVYTDYHNIKGWPRVFLYSIAAVPPLLTGYFRIQSGRHFKTDVMVGMLVGSTSGILVPELFRKKDGAPRSVMLSPYYVPDGGGVSMSLALNAGKKTARSFSF